MLNLADLQVPLADKTTPCALVGGKLKNEIRSPSPLDRSKLCLTHAFKRVCVRLLLAGICCPIATVVLVDIGTASVPVTSTAKAFVERKREREGEQQSFKLTICSYAYKSVKLTRKREGQC